MVSVDLDGTAWDDDDYVDDFDYRDCLTDEDWAEIEAGAQAKRCPAASTRRASMSFARCCPRQSARQRTGGAGRPQLRKSTTGA